MTADSFSDRYGEAREKFVAAARDAEARLHCYGRDDVKGAEGEPLACDVAVLGRDDAERVAIVITGTHGVECFAASAILHQWLRSPQSLAEIGDVAVVLVHALNCWGFSHKTRATENNVDLNRNCMAHDDEYARENPSYDKLVPFLHTGVFTADENLRAYRAYKSYLDEHGWHIENEMLEGQSHRPDGLFYTGTGPEWANRTFRRIVGEHLSAATTIGFIDWHTAVGSFGEIVYLIFDDEGSPEHEAAASWWRSSGADKAAFAAGAVPKYRGLVCRAIRQELPSPRIAGAVVEFGTVDAYTLFRADRLDRWLWFEGRQDPQYSQFREDYKDVNCPRDVAWRRLVLSKGPAIIDRLIKGVKEW
jgi:Protein of unknown function (DUF2817)